MTSNFSLIGFDLGDVERLGEVLSSGRFEVSQRDFGTATYLVAADGNGAELWLAMEGQQVRSMNPMFTAAPPCQVTLDAVPFPNAEYARFEAKLDITLWQDGEIATRARVF